MNGVRVHTYASAVRRGARSPLYIWVGRYMLVNAHLLCAVHTGERRARARTMLHKWISATASRRSRIGVTHVHVSMCVRQYVLSLAAWSDARRSTDARDPTDAVKWGGVSEDGVWWRSNGAASVVGCERMERALTSRASAARVAFWREMRIGGTVRTRGVRELFVRRSFAPLPP